MIQVVPSGVVAATASPGTVETIGTWSAPLVLTASASADGRHFIFGGCEIVAGGACVRSSAVQRYIPGLGAPVPTSAVFPTSRQSVAAASQNGDVYLFGGDDGSRNLADIHRYSPTTDTLTRMNAQLPSPRQGAAAFSDGTYIYVLGGDASNSNAYGTRLREILRYDPILDRVEKMPWQLPRPLSFAGLAWTGERAVLFGGFVEPYAPSDLVLEFDPDTGNFLTSATRLPSPRNAMSAVWDGTAAWAFGGSNCCSRYSEVFRYDVTMHVLSISAYALPSGLNHYAALCSGGVAHLMGGDIAHATRNDKIIAVHLTPGSTCPAPEPSHRVIAARIGESEARTLTAVAGSVEATRAEGSLTRGSVNASTNRVLVAIANLVERVEGGFTDLRADVATLRNDTLAALSELRNEVNTRFDQLLDRIDAGFQAARAQLEDVRRDVLGAISSHDAATEASFEELRERIDTLAARESLVISIEDEGVAGNRGPFLVHASLNGARVNPAWTATLDGEPSGDVRIEPLAEGSFLVRVNASTLAPRLLVLDAAWGTHRGSVATFVGEVPPDFAATGLGGAVSYTPGTRVERVLYSNTVEVPEQTIGTPGASAPLASVHGSWNPDGRYAITLDLLGSEDAVSFSPPFAVPPLPDLDATLIERAPEEVGTMPGASLTVEVLARYDADAKACLPSAPCAPVPPAEWLLSDGAATALVVRARITAAGGSVSESPEVVIPLAGQLAGSEGGA